MEEGEENDWVRVMAVHLNYSLLLGYIDYLEG